MNSKSESLLAVPDDGRSPEDRLADAESTMVRRLVAIVWLVVVAATFAFVIWLVAWLESVSG